MSYNAKVSKKPDTLFFRSQKILFRLLLKNTKFWIKWEVIPFSTTKVKSNTENVAYKNNAFFYLLKKNVATRDMHETKISFLIPVNDLLAISLTSFLNYGMTTHFVAKSLFSQPTYLKTYRLKKTHHFVLFKMVLTSSARPLKSCHHSSSMNVCSRKLHWLSKLMCRLELET